MSSSQPIICVPKRAHRVLRRTHRVCRETQCGSVSSLLRNSTLEKQYSAHFLKLWLEIPGQDTPGASRFENEVERGDTSDFRGGGGQRT